MSGVCGILHNTLIHREVLCRTHSPDSVKHMDLLEGPDLVVSGQQMQGMTVFCVFLC
ncbi:hypothetical protein BDFB_009861 [Asbolus verrucosus]|uniref:Uncharacterized protein n=1 Tax=Asbolus verrucosus TaxID=1661398 RepID=A0A482VV04_ASBVE|nr:hypothetical protein BDFB_009861 [Asbolus verrucosus]